MVGFAIASEEQRGPLKHVSTQLIFGYGSLVSQRSIEIPIQSCKPSQITGFRRVWREPFTRQDRTYVGLALQADDAAPRIAGVTLEFAETDLPYIYNREKSYRHIAIDAVDQAGNVDSTITFEGLALPRGKAVIPVSYLAVVLSGFEDIFGAAGPDLFARETSGWEQGVALDIERPVYPRAPANLASLAKRYLPLIERYSHID